MGLNFLILVTLILLTSAIHQVGSSNSPRFVRSECPRKDFSYSLGGTFEASLNHTLLEILPNNVLVNGSSSFVSGQGIDQVNALCFCRGDIPPQDCRDCVRSAAGTVLQHCRPLKEGIAWYEECTLRYSNRSIFSLEEEVPSYRSYNFSSVLTKLEDYNKVFDGTMDGLIRQAASGSTAVGKLRGFATSEAELAGSGLTLRGLVQCSPDIVGGPCERCLRSALKQMDGWSTNIIFLPSCNLRFDLFPSKISPTKQPGPGGITRKVAIQLAVAVISLLILCGITGVAYLQWNSIWGFYNQVLVPSIRGLCNRPQVPTSPLVDLKPWQYTFKDLERATKNFSNEIGSGGFATVYEGTLPNKQKIAVKRLKNKSQEDEDFKKEVFLMAKLQHQNLVGLLGFCLEGNKQLLVSEYFRNGSLDKFLFDGPRRKKHLNWKTRYNIIKGIARGILYLHRDSPTRIIHRDLKPDNILLDEKMNPKVADFGLARITNLEQSHIDTSRAAGTIGYIAPELLYRGEFSVESDVYSFGVIVLEVVSGRRICASVNQSGSEVETLLPFAWSCWAREKMDLMDKTLRGLYKEEEAERCIQLGLLCTQMDKSKRPMMETVVRWLNPGSGALDIPEEHPVFLQGLEENTYNSLMQKMIREPRISQHEGESSGSKSMPAGQNSNDQTTNRPSTSTSGHNVESEIFYSPTPSPLRK